MRSIFITISIVLSNFVYQYIFKDVPDWITAIDRSYFQIIAVVCYNTCMRMAK